MNGTKNLYVKPTSQFKLSKIDTVTEPLYKSDDDFERKFEKVRTSISRRQDLLYADGRHAILMIFQGMDASGKDSVIKHTMTCLNPQGTIVTAFGRPSDEENKHDFMWRTHAKLPPRGKIGIFNRSYYEEVLTVRVHRETLYCEKLPANLTRAPEIWQNRLEDIKNYEHYLHRQGISVLKFFLHVSKQEQRKRLLERLNDPAKNWKFDPSDMKERALWGKFRGAYEEALRSTSTLKTPWYVIPADDKKNTRMMIASILLEKLEELPLKSPKFGPGRQHEIDLIRRSFSKK